MPNIEEDTKLDFKDVLLRPKRSKIKSRADVSSSNIIQKFRITLLILSIYVKFKSMFLKCFIFQVDLRRTFKFHNSKGTHQGVPIIASNMDTVGTFEMAAALAKVRKFYDQFII